MALRLSCLVHGLLLLVAGCTAHRPVRAAHAVADAEVVETKEIVEAKEFVGAVSDKMPAWDADGIARYERVEIATVKADIAMAQQEDGKDGYLTYVTKLHQDWEALIALDERLKVESLT
jgi:hypothetical protein